MGSDWKSAKLEDCLMSVIDNRGKTPPNSKIRTPYELIEVNALKESYKHPNYSAIRKFVDKQTFEKWFRNGHPKNGDVLISTVGSIGEVAISEGRGCIAQNVVALQAKSNIATGEFLYYSLQNPAVKSQLLSLDISSVQPSIKVPHLLEIEITIPPVTTQCAIAHILGSLDDKIELNRQMNRTLEKMVQAIFKSWFIDFDPVHAKAEGRDPGLPKDIADLFPDSFEDSELGKIPKGWAVKPIGDAVQCVGGATPSTKKAEFWDGGTNPFLTPKDMSSLISPVILDTARHITDAGVEKISSKRLPAGTVILSSRAPIGYLAISEVPVSVNQGIIAMICNGDLPNHYVLLWTLASMETIKGKAGGTTFAEISKKNFRPIPALIPATSILDAFTKQVEPLFQQVVENVVSAESLARARDTLLPKLISGELSIPDAERILEGVE